MTGSHDRSGNIVLEWNSQAEKLYSPDGTQHCLPCDRCGQPQWVSLLTVSVLCDRCVADADLGLADEPDHDDTVHCCPDCERPNQFGELCASCASDRGEQAYQ